MQQPQPSPQGAANPNLAMFANLSQGKPPVTTMPPPPGAGAPPMPPHGAPPMAPRMMPPGAHAQPQAGGMPPAAAGAPQGQGPLPPQMLQMLQQVAQMGRGGDTLLAHLTPGEVAVPPEVQTPKVLAVIDKEMEKKGVDIKQFTAGSPQSSINPQTTLPEYNFMSAFLPAALGLAGSVLLPGAGLAMSPMLAGAVGGGLGTAAGGLLAGQDPMQALLAGAGSGLGSYALGSIMGGGTAAAEAAQQAASQASPGAAAQAIQADPAFNFSNFMKDATAAAPAAAAPVSGPMNLWGMLPSDINPASAIGGAVGGYLGGQMGAPTPKMDPSAGKPAGFHDRMPAVGDMPPWQQSIGQSTYNGVLPDFTGYNALDPMSHTRSFFPSGSTLPTVPRV